MSTLADKLNPDVVKCSGRFTAMLGFILRERWTDPAIVDMVITSDGFLLLGSETDPMDNEFVGHESDLWRNLRDVARTAGLTARETTRLLTLAQARVRRA
jgi:hypothetical protein